MISAKVVLDGKYRWSGNFGCWFSSIESRRKYEVGDVKMICGVLCYVYKKSNLYLFESEYWWVPVDEKVNNHDGLRHFKSKLI